MHDTAIAALRRGATAEALASARELVDSRPEDANAWRLLSAAQRLAGDHEEAVAALDRALELAPDDADLHMERAGLFLHARQLDEAQVALARSVGLDPNQFPAYVIQAQLALGRGQLDEAERLVRTAARIAPDHPQLKAVEGMLALRRDRPAEAMAILAAASAAAPDEPMLLYPLGMAYLANGHGAFAEQAFRRLLAVRPESNAVRAMIADTVRRQGRPGDAADELAPLLDRDDAPPALYRLVGELELQAGRPERALPRLKHALAHLPGDRRTLAALIAIWERTDDRSDARSTLDAALATHPQLHDLWLARLGVEPFASPGALAVIDRWLAAMPDHMPALVARMTALAAAGEYDAAEAAARRVVELEPGHAHAEMHLVEALLRRDPEAAVARMHELIADAPDPRVQRTLRRTLAHLYDASGRQAEAVDAWLALHAEDAARHPSPPPASGHAGPWPEAAAAPEGGSVSVLVWGAPGSMVERIVRILETGGAPILLDRYFGQTPPNDPLQRFDTPQALAEGRLDPASVAAEWRAGLPARGMQGQRSVFDWLPHWDNALLLALRPHLPEGVLLVALRDPRDMLLDWLAYGAPLALRFDSPVEAARWLAGILGQVADIHEQGLYPYRLIRMDGIADDPQAVSDVLASALGLEAPPPLRIDSLGAPRLHAGHWRHYADVLGEAFGILEPVALRLGYTA